MPIDSRTRQTQTMNEDDDSMEIPDSLQDFIGFRSYRNPMGLEEAASSTSPPPPPSSLPSIESNDNSKGDGIGNENRSNNDAIEEPLSSIVTLVAPLPPLAPQRLTLSTHLELINQEHALSNREKDHPTIFYTLEI